jgi:hypothetical protein
MARQTVGETVVALNTHGDPVADAGIYLTGFMTLTAEDFVR